MLQSVFSSLSLTEFTQIEIRAYKALVSRAFDGSSATLDAGDTLMDKALVAFFLERLFLLDNSNFFLNNSFERFIAWTYYRICLFFFIRNFYGFLLNGSR
jgi:hypothetical protein